MEITVLIPCLNEAESIVGCVAEAWEGIRLAAVQGEVLVADNGSTDGSQELARQAGARIVEVHEKGYGRALAAGIAAAHGRYVLMGDADGSYDFRELPRFLERLRTGEHLVMGCRFPRCGGRIEPGAMPWKHRWIGNPVLSWLGRLFFRVPVDDFHCGLRAFHRDSILALGLSSPGMEFASEMVAKAAQAELRIGQIPVVLRPDRRSRPPHLRSWRDGWRHLRFMLLFSPRWLFIYPGLALTLLGLLGMAMLLPKPLRIHQVTFDLNSLLVSGAAVISGFQIILFGIFARLYAMGAGLLPETPRWRALAGGAWVEWGILAGLLLFLLGLGLIGRAVLEWRDTGFGPLSVSHSLRLTIPGVVSLCLGIQVLFSGFLIGILGLRR